MFRLSEFDVMLWCGYLKRKQYHAAAVCDGLNVILCVSGVETASCCGTIA